MRRPASLIACFTLCRGWGTLTWLYLEKSGPEIPSCWIDLQICSSPSSREKTKQSPECSTIAVPPFPVQSGTKVITVIKSMDLWNVFLPYVPLINCRFHLFRSSASSFSSQYLLLFLKSSRSCVLLPTFFHFRHLAFNGIMKKAISSQNITYFRTQQPLKRFDFLQMRVSLSNSILVTLCFNKRQSDG